MRMFDLRALEHSTIVYETAPALVPVVREETAGAGVVGGSGRKGERCFSLFLFLYGGGCYCFF